MGRERVGAVIVAAGASTRMASVDKTLALLGGAPLIARTVETFEACAAVDEVVVVAAEHNFTAVEGLRLSRGWRKVSAVCLGGARRQDSVRLGLAALGACEWALVHDGARPLVSPGLIERGIEAASGTGVAIAAVTPKDTVKELAADGDVGRTLERAQLVAVQTPQVFRRGLLERAHAEIADDVTDDAAMVERLGMSVSVYEGDYANIKVTTPDDLAVAEALLAVRGAPA